MDGIQCRAPTYSTSQLGKGAKPKRNAQPTTNNQHLSFAGPRVQIIAPPTSSAFLLHPHNIDFHQLHQPIPINQLPSNHPSTPSIMAYTKQTARKVSIIYSLFPYRGRDYRDLAFATVLSPRFWASTRLTFIPPQHI